MAERCALSYHHRKEMMIIHSPQWETNPQQWRLIKYYTAAPRRQTIHDAKYSVNILYIFSMSRDHEIINLIDSIYNYVIFLLILN